MAATKISTSTPAQASAQATSSSNAVDAAPVKKTVRVSVKNTDTVKIAQDIASSITQATAEKVDTKKTPAALPEAIKDDTKVDDVIPSTTTTTDTPMDIPMTTRVSQITFRLNLLKANLTSEVKDLELELKQLQKDLVKHMKQVTAASKGQNRRKANKSVSGEAGASEPHRNSGFQKPVAISNELADFLGVPHGDLLPRMEVTRRINTYIRENNLQNPDDRRQILPDNALRSILRTGPEISISYFNYQRFLKIHFIAPLPPA